MQVGTVSGVADELVVAAEDVLSTSDVLVEAEEDGSLRGDVPATAALGTAGRAAPTALGGGDDLFLFVLIRNLHGDLEVGPGRRQAFQQDGVVAHPGSLGELGGESRAILLGAVDARDDVVEARVEDDLHAAVDLGPCDCPRDDLGVDDFVNAGLEGLAGEVSSGHGEVPPDEPGDGGNGVGGGGLVQAGLLPEEGFEDLGRGAGSRR